MQTLHVDADTRDVCTRLSQVSTAICGARCWWRNTVPWIDVTSAILARDCRPTVALVASTEAVVVQQWGRMSVG
jgi:hypothetical protein